MDGSWFLRGIVFFAPMVAVLSLLAAMSGQHALSEPPDKGLSTDGVVVNVVDGDTVDVELRFRVRVRLLGIDSPEPRGESRDAGRAATEHIKTLIGEGSQVRLHIPTEGARSMLDIMTFGRVLGQVWRLDEEGNPELVSISQQMLDSGHAVEYTPR